MKKTMLIALTAGILSAAGAMEAREFRVQPQPRQTEQRQRTESRAANRSERPTHNASLGNRMGQARNYNRRPGGMHIHPDYFATHFGHDHGFHFADCGPRVVGGELYFSFNGGWFGVMGPVPGNWGFQTDYLYIGIGDDGNYYLYDAQFPDVSVQLTFVQSPGDDQSGDDQD